MPYTIDDARAYINQVRWQFADTMRQWPHCYTVRDWRPELEQEFVDFVALIRKTGIIKPWPADVKTPRYHHTYLEIDGWDYWSMGAPSPETTVINRARLDDVAAGAVTTGESRVVVNAAQVALLRYE